MAALDPVTIHLLMTHRFEKTTQSNAPFIIAAGLGENVRVQAYHRQEHELVSDLTTELVSGSVYSNGSVKVWSKDDDKTRVVNYSVETAEQFKARMFALEMADVLAGTRSMATALAAVNTAVSQFESRGWAT